MLAHRARRKAFQIPSIMQVGKAVGMVTLNEAPWSW
jgi:hypothetical protein